MDHGTDYVLALHPIVPCFRGLGVWGLGFWGFGSRVLGIRVTVGNSEVEELLTAKTLPALKIALTPEQASLKP